MVVRLERPTRSIHTGLLAIFGIACAWVILYHANILFSDLLVHSRFASWIFLPAAVRILSVILFGWRASIGLFLGTFFTGIELNLAMVNLLPISAISALAPLCAADICQRLLRVPADFSGFSPAQLGLFAIGGAFANTLFSQVYLALSGLGDGCFGCVISMFVGDVTGTAIILFAAQMALRLLPLRF